MTERFGRNIILSNHETPRYYLLSDIHWDNPHCDWDVLTECLDKAKEDNARIAINGDMFCLMEGKGDNRGAKNLRQEHTGARYIDKVVNTAVDFFEPYAHLIDFVGYGNHETAVLKHKETDVIERFVTICNDRYGSNIKSGGYGGWYVVRKVFRGNTKYLYRIKYHHGWGGGAPVTGGKIKFARIRDRVDGADCIWLGHIHRSEIDYHTKEDLSHSGRGGFKIKQKMVTCVCTPAFKDEFADGSEGFQNERNNANKPIGYWTIDFSENRKIRNGEEIRSLNADFTPHHRR